MAATTFEDHEVGKLESSGSNPKDVGRSLPNSLYVQEFEDPETAVQAGNRVVREQTLVHVTALTETIILNFVRTALAERYIGRAAVKPLQLGHACAVGLITISPTFTPAGCPMA